MDRPVSAVDGVLGSRSSLARWGVRSWLLVGLLAAGALVAWMLAQVSGFVVPLVVAGVLGALFAPVVDRLHGRGVPRSVGALAVLTGLVAVVVGSTWLVVAGLVDQGPQIATQLAAGLDTLGGWLEARGVEVASGESLTAQLGASVQEAVGGVGAAVSGLFSGVVSFGIGAAMGAFLVYYVLVDWPGLTRWVGGHVGLDAGTGTEIVGDAAVSVRRYFWALTVSAVVTAVLIGGTAWALGVPLAFTIAVVTLVTSYVPYLGAIVSGAFATLIALGANGVDAAIIMPPVTLPCSAK